MSKRGSSEIAGLAALCAGSLTGAGIVAQIPVDSGSWEAIGKLPVTIGLIALCAWSLWLAFRQLDKTIKAQQDVASAMREMARHCGEQMARRYNEKKESFK